MSGAEKIAISAALGGTAEALGGGKFANGAVTGAYVIIFQHQMEISFSTTMKQAATLRRRWRKLAENLESG